MFQRSAFSFNQYQFDWKRCQLIPNHNMQKKRWTLARKLALARISKMYVQATKCATYVVSTVRMATDATQQ
jgi:hypothetical protein